MIEDVIKQESLGQYLKEHSMSVYHQNFRSLLFILVELWIYIIFLNDIRVQ